MHAPSAPFRGRVYSALACIGIWLLTGCHRTSQLPGVSTPAYAEFVSVFYTGLAALQVGDDVRADSELAKSTQMAAGEPAGWGDWGILALRQRNYDAAAQRLEQARKLVPENDNIYYLMGLVESGRGHAAEAIADYRKALGYNSNNLIAAYQLAEELERQGEAGSEAEFEKLMQQIVELRPENIPAQLELARIAAKRGDVGVLRQAISQVEARSQAWPPEVQQQLGALRGAANGSDPRAAALRTTYLRNVLMRQPEFRQSLAAIKPPPGEEAKPFTRFLRLPTPSMTPAAPDTALTYSPQQIAKEGNATWGWIGAISLSDTGNPVIAKANGSTVHLSSGATLPFPGGSKNRPPQVEGVLPVDFNYDFKTDLVLAGDGGVRFFRQDSPDRFSDVTALTKLSKSIVSGHYSGAWAVDIEADGDLDIVLGAESGVPTVLRNNGDGTFTPITPFVGVSGVSQFVWADLNSDGNPDATMIDGSGRLRIFQNERLGKFVEMKLPELGEIKAVTAADLGQGVLSLILVRANGSVTRLLEAEGQSATWQVDEVARVPDATNRLAGQVRLHAGDFDNNGAIDLLLGKVGGAGQNGALLWLGDEHGKFDAPKQLDAATQVLDAADTNGNGSLDLLGLSADGQAVLGVPRGSKQYHWQVIRPRAKQAVGDQRINSFGVGGQIEVRSGLLVQMAPITGPQVHFGLGEHTGVDVARILWPNGSVRAEFALKGDQSVVTEQRLKGSCPFLFAYNGKGMQFVKDAVPWGSAIGLRINAIGSADIAATEEWYKIGRDELVPRDGYYDLRITGELWETYYYDYLKLLAVDHPAGTEIFTDERFIVPAAKPRVIAVGTVHKLAGASDDRGQDVTALVRDLDGEYLDTFGRGQYQGVTRDHYVELNLGEDVPAGGPLYLIAKGWLHPSDSSINVALGQGHHEAPRPLSLEVLDEHGKWVVAKPNLGFPAGRKKICLIDISGVFRPGAPHKLRLRTNLEVYWDSIEWAQGVPDAPLRITKIDPATAELRYRGFSKIEQANTSSPEIPDYEHLSGTSQRWRDLSGFYTRYGDVHELLAGIDDRYVIMNAGDELALRFPAQPQPPTGLGARLCDRRGWLD